MKQEQKNTEQCMVSVSCITYNHEALIARAIQGFLMQKTKFPFEILIHDDASTDRTREIIEEYEKKYPSLIKAVYQTENQYSRGISNISGVFNFPRAQGKYIAMCEGDDYWIDENKLQIQVDYMEAHPQCTMCFHAALIESEDHAMRDREVRPYHGNRICSAKEVIDKKSNYPTASLLFLSDLAKKLPRYYYECPVGDVPIHIFMASRGEVYYIDRKMSVYQQGVAVSWSTMMEQGNYKENLINHHNQMKQMYSDFSEETGYRYKEEIASQFQRMDFLTFLNTKEYGEVLKPRYRKYYRELNFRTRFFLKLDVYFPGLYKSLQKLWYLLHR